MSPESPSESSDSAPARRPAALERSRIRRILALAAPITLANVSHTFVSLADTLMVGRCGERALAALGAAAAIHLTLFLVVTAIFSGVQVLCARRIGEGRPEGAGAVFSTGLAIGAGLALLTSLSGLLLADRVTAAFNPDPLVRTIAADYLHFRWGMGLPAVILLFVFKGFFWGVGITRLDLFTSLFVNALNIAFNWVFIFGNLGAPALGAPGAGLASALSALCALVVSFRLVKKGERWQRFGIRFLRRPDRDSVLGILRLSVPRSVQAAAFGLSSLPFFGMIGNLIGSEAQGASAVIWRIHGLSVLVAIGIGTATATLVSRSLGEKRPDEARAYGWCASVVGIAAVGSLSLALFCFARPILRAFDLSEATATLALPALRFVLLFQIVDAVGIILSRALTGAGQVLFVMVAEILVATCICVPLARAGIHFMDGDPLLGAWFGWTGYMCAWMLTMVLRWRSGAWNPNAGDPAVE